MVQLRQENKRTLNVLRPVSASDATIVKRYDPSGREEVPSPGGYTGEKTSSAGAAKREPSSDTEQRELQRLRDMDRRVRQHEQAHLAAGGGYVRGGAQYTYVRGPDGKMYATGGEVSIDVSPARTPEATIAKMQQVRRAALAPADPSPQDRNVAAAATRAEMEARRKLAEQALEEQRARIERRGENRFHTPKNAPEAVFPSMTIPGMIVSPPGEMIRGA
ncbi:MAG: hypothetical protein KBH78_07915 [Candidatus Hydrogenedentes bacterium]|nr:hypothetical protein [Candidatus Hydrogenedentota bacterium]